jgi:hypothetical protein
MAELEHWLRGVVPGVPALLQPVAHALLQVVDDVDRALAGVSAGEVWTEPAGAASIGFHCRHLAGSIDRLFTYARGEALSPAQLAALAVEREPGHPRPTRQQLVQDLRASVECALAQLASTPEAGLAAPREVGRAHLPSTVIGLLVHAAEHAARHAGQIVTTARVLRGGPPSP